jgi:hypothetical protein
MVVHASMDKTSLVTIPYPYRFLVHNTWKYKSSHGKLTNIDFERGLMHIARLEKLTLQKPSVGCTKINIYEVDC